MSAVRIFNVAALIKGVVKRFTERRLREKSWRMKFLKRFHEVFGSASYLEKRDLLRVAAELFGEDRFTLDLDFVVRESAEHTFL